MVQGGASVPCLRVDGISGNAEFIASQIADGGGRKDADREVISWGGHCLCDDNWDIGPEYEHMSALSRRNAASLRLIQITGSHSGKKLGFQLIEFR